MYPLIDGKISEFKEYKLDRLLKRINS